MGQKPDDFWTISLCRDHHAEQHTIGEQRFEKLHGIEMRFLAIQFATVSPKWSEIVIARKERENG